MSSDSYKPKRQHENPLEVLVREPPRYKVLLHNDDYTTMEFVILILREVFHKSVPEAEKIMKIVHESGLGVCGEYTEEVAETKVSQVHVRARKLGYPLRCSMEPA